MVTNGINNSLKTELAKFQCLFRAYMTVTTHPTSVLAQRINKFTKSKYLPLS